MVLLKFSVVCAENFFWGIICAWIHISNFGFFCSFLLCFCLFWFQVCSWQLRFVGEFCLIVFLNETNLRRSIVVVAGKGLWGFREKSARYRTLLLLFTARSKRNFNKYLFLQFRVLLTLLWCKAWLCYQWRCNTRVAIGKKNCDHERNFETSSLCHTKLGSLLLFFSKCGYANPWCSTTNCNWWTASRSMFGVATTWRLVQDLSCRNPVWSGLQSQLDFFLVLLVGMQHTHCNRKQIVLSTFPELLPLWNPLACLFCSWPWHPHFSENSFVIGNNWRRIYIE